MTLATTFTQALSAYAAVAAAAAAVGALLFSLGNRKRIQEVHVLVNSNLTEIKRQLAAVTAERDELRPEPDHA